jgi:tricorn protease
VFLLLAFFAVSTFAQGTKLLREPRLSRESFVFVYANDLWTVLFSSGSARLLTTNEGYESSPHFSDDGKWIAFSSEYDGNTDVYSIPY